VRVVQLVFSIGVFRFTKLQFSGLYPFRRWTASPVQWFPLEAVKGKCFFLNTKYCYLCRVCQKGRTPKKVHDLFRVPNHGTLRNFFFYFRPFFHAQKLLEVLNIGTVILVYLKNSGISQFFISR
jgi:hypothetical protein